MVSVRLFASWAWPRYVGTDCGTRQKEPTPIPGNEQTASPGYTSTYDATCYMSTSTPTSAGDVWTYTYNFRNLMTGAVENSSTGTILAQVTYTYDALDNRIGMDENGTQTWTLYDGSDPIMDFNSSGSLEMRYLNGPTGQLVDSVIARESAGGTIAWYLPDRLGTVRDLISNSGAIIDHIDFSAFGTVLDQSDASEGDRMMGFAGMELDSVTGLNLAVNRMQNPGTGRWTSQDPLGFGAGDANLFRYVDNTPPNAVDPEGLSFGSNWSYFVDWLTGRGPRIRDYGPGSTESQDMQGSPGGNKLRDKFYQGGCKDTTIDHTTPEAGSDTLPNPWQWGSTALPVGGFIGIAKNNGDGTVTFRIKNVTGTYSAFYHLVPDLPWPTGPMSNIIQIIEWTEPIDPSLCGPAAPPPPPKREPAQRMGQAR
jgi:RHS repeat-associated protein